MFRVCCQALDQCRKLLARKTITSDEVFGIYMKIASWREMLQKTLSVFLFLTTLGFFHAFNTVTFYKGHGRLSIFNKPPFSYVKIICSFTHFFSWIILLVSAAEVNEQDKSLRKIDTECIFQHQRHDNMQPLDYI
ncbi:hypothetical protein NPIL_8341 [Nephila pilipes]|uniref:Uncharacterized protein n=1 Tax=Nephila pilipes TaxID=299642 RepID=A0A8X6Q7V2_NEPPI|nr:hypothetical protein NPIL_8341 [Nephila pilipes]